MKALVAVAFVFLFPVSAFAGDITLTTPEVITPVAVKVSIESYRVDADAIVANINWVDADGSVVKRETVAITGTAMSDIVDNVIGAGDVGKKLGTLMEKKIRQAVKSVRNITGTVSP